MSEKTFSVLTNLQRGNVKQESPMLAHQRTVHELAAQGELYNLESDLVDLLDANNMTPLFWAAGYGQSSTVEYLIKAGANPNHKANLGRTLLMLASSKGFLSVVKTLIANGANLDEIDDAGNTALFYAAHQNHALVVQELISKGANIGIANSNGQTAYSISLVRRSKAAQAAIELLLVSMLRGAGDNSSID